MLLGVQANGRRPVEQILFRLVNGWAGGLAGGPARGPVGERSGGRAVGEAVGRDILIHDKWL